MSKGWTWRDNMKHPNDKALYIKTESPHGSGQIVLHVTDTFKEGYVCFDDTNRGHMIQGKIVAEDDETFTFIDKHDEKWVFEIVTIEKFKGGMHRHVFNGEEIAKECDTTEELWEYFRKLFPLNGE